MIIDKSNNIIEKIHTFFKDQNFSAKEIKIIADCFKSLKKKHSVLNEELILPYSNLLDLILSVTDQNHFLADQDERYDYYIFLDEKKKTFFK